MDGGNPNTASFSPHGVGVPLNERLEVLDLETSPLPSSSTSPPGHSYPGQEPQTSFSGRRDAWMTLRP
ncbi:hypothetical protein QYE76_064123 [Lolium multiflorum]|uniref:Uncharacterized protein n=1 Tax=Lolium multiflorum TaxID=4521 RepID=A0AAD8S7Q9_LOLMU|nr:hypothetical protein QYE76_064123 [Lolium multiflorum]